MVSVPRIEVQGWALVVSLETHRGFTLTLTDKRSGFNGLSINRMGDVRKIEVKTVGRNDRWFAVNGLRGIERLFFDHDYWIYFALLPENRVVTVHSVAFLQKQTGYTGASQGETLRNWLRQTSALSKEFGLRFIPRIHLHMRVPIRRMVEQILSEPDQNEWIDVVEEIWQSKEKGWERLFPSCKESGEK